MKFRRHREHQRHGVASPFDQVVQAAKAGDDRSVSLLYLDHVAMVYGYLGASGASEPEDLTSQVFLGMLRGLDRFNGDEADFRKWLMTIAHRRLVDHRRRQSRNRTELSAPTSLEEMRDGLAWADLPALEMDSALVEAFGRLTDAQREVLALRFIADVSLQGVAAITGRPTGAIKSLQNRGLESLRRQMSASKAELDA